MSSENPDFESFVTDCLHKHFAGDWGQLDPEDKAANEQALVRGERLLSSYPIHEQLRGYAGNDRLWIITEADRSVATVLWPSEY